MSPRSDSVRSQLARLGFEDPDEAARRLGTLGPDAGSLPPLLARTAAPSRALEALVDLAGAMDDPEPLLTEVADDEGTAMRLLAVLGASPALARHLLRHPEHWQELTDPTLGSTRPAAYAVRAGLLRAVGADPGDPHPVATLEDAAALDALRVEYRRVLLRLAARDLAHDLAVDDAAAELSDLAAGTLEAALAVARARVGDAADTCRLAVIAMGK